MITINQTFIVSLGAENKTVKVDQCRISEMVNRFYDVATFTLDYEPPLETAVTIVFGDRTFTGSIYATTKVNKGTYSIECRTGGAKLTEPNSPYEETYDQATTSHDLCAEYATKTGLTITNTAYNLDFGGSYQRTGTMLNALTNIANVTGAEFWDNWDGIIIAPNKAIDSYGTQIKDEEIIDFAITKDTVYNKGVGSIIVRNGGSLSNDIISINGLYAEIDECTAETFIYPNPYGVIESTSGLSPLIPIIQDRSETQSILDVDTLRLNAPISSITNVMLNGIEITDFNFVADHNVIYFNSLKRGTLTVNYMAKGYRGYANISTTPLGRFITFDVYYLDQILSFQSFLSEDCSTLGSTDGDMTCIMPREVYYHKGIEFWTIGGSPEFAIYSNSIELDQSQILVDGDTLVPPIVSVAFQYVSVEDVTLEPKDGGGYRYRTRYAVDALNRYARSAGTDVSFTIVHDTADGADDWYFEFTQYYPALVVSYETPSMKHNLRFDNIDGVMITLVVRNTNTDQVCEYELDGINGDDMYSIPCLLDQFVPVDVASALGVEVSQASGKSIPYQNPNHAESNVTVDAFGVVKIWVDMDGAYVIDTSTIKNRTTVTLIANVNGGVL